MGEEHQVITPMVSVSSGAAPGRVLRRLRDMLQRARRRISRIGGFEPVTALPPGEGHFIDVPLIDREDLADHWPESVIGAAEPLPGQHGTDKEKRAAPAALMALSPPERQLSLNVPLLEMNQVKPPHLPGQMDHEGRLPNGPDPPVYGLSETVVSIHDESFFTPRFFLFVKSRQVRLSPTLRSSRR